MKKKKLATLLIATLLLVNESAVAFAGVNDGITEVEQAVILEDENSNNQNSERNNLTIDNSTLENSTEEVKDDLEEDNTANEENANSNLDEETSQEQENIVSEEGLVKDETNDENEVETEDTLEGIQTYSNENSTKGTAKNISLNVSNTFSIKESYEDMWAKFTLPSDGYITINLDKVLMGQSEEKTMNLTLEDESGRVVYLNTSSEYAGNDGTKINKWTIGLAAGTYYLNLEASFYINLGQYDLKYKVDYVKDSNFEKEKNDSISTANVIELNKTYKGILNESGVTWRSDEDYYAVDIKNSNFVLKVKHNIDSKYIYYIYDSYGNDVDYIYESEMEYENGGIYTYTLKNLVSGRYYIKVYSYNNVKKDPYEITISEAKNGWVTEGGKTYYYDLGKKITGLADIDGQTYYFDNSGVMKTGWITTSGYWYYFNPNTGAMHKGWLKSGSSWYYLNSTTGIMVTGAIYIGNDLYCFDKNGVMQSGKWYKDDYGTWYYLKSSGAGYKGWLKEGGKWYYLDEDYAYMVTGATNVRGVMYLFNESGVMNTSSGWKKIYGSYYYANSNGTVKTGWLKDNGKWYYLNSYGVMATYDYNVNGITYYFGQDGAMRTGWQYLYSNKFYRYYYFYFGNDGAMRTGWQSINGVTYYFIQNSNNAPTGSMATGSWTIDGIWYYFDINGKLLY